MTGTQPRPLRAPSSLKLDGCTYKFGLMPATLAMRVATNLPDFVAGRDDGSGMPVNELMAYITCDGESVLAFPEEHAGPVFAAFLTYNFTAFAPKRARQ